MGDILSSVVSHWYVPNLRHPFALLFNNNKSQCFNYRSSCHCLDALVLFSINNWIPCFLNFLHKVSDFLCLQFNLLPRLIEKLNGRLNSFFSVLIPVIVALFLLMILHPLTLQLSKRYILPHTIWRSREVAQIGTIDSVSSGGRIGSEVCNLAPLAFSRPIWLAEVCFIHFLIP